MPCSLRFAQRSSKEQRDTLCALAQQSARALLFCACYLRTARTCVRAQGEWKRSLPEGVEPVLGAIMLVNTQRDQLSVRAASSFATMTTAC